MSTTMCLRSQSPPRDLQSWLCWCVTLLLLYVASAALVVHTIFGLVSDAPQLQRWEWVLGLYSCSCAFLVVVACHRGCCE